MKYTTHIAAALNVKAQQVAETIAMLDEGNTIPFIARYRKEVTGGLDEEQIRYIAEELARLRALDDRRETILNTIEEQGKLTPELEKRIHATQSRTELEDLYQPYKPKRRTRASIARKKGLEDLAQILLKQDPNGENLTKAAAPFLGEEVHSAEEAWQGARDIVAETISDHAQIRQTTRKKALKYSVQETVKKKKGEDPRQVYKSYYDLKTRVDRLRPHQILAINRAEEEGILKVTLDIPERDWRQAISAHFRGNPSSPYASQLEEAIDDAANRLLLPAIERDVRRVLTDKAEDHAIQVFAKNLRALLLQPPLADHTIMGLDPGYRTGCKVAVVDATGKSLATGTIYPVPPRNQVEAAKKTLVKLIQKYNVSLIAIGNGTASRETEQFVADLIADMENIHYLIVNEAGASVYSASKLARQELPDMDVSLRGAVSIARRIQDPLAELVKIDPQSIGVGLYQHDVNQAKLTQKLDDVVESVVNNVGVDINTASPALLSRVAGIGPTLANRIVAYRDAHGPFSNRDALLNVPGVGPKTFQQAAGFLRIRGGDNPLDASAIHPESYPVAQAVLAQADIQADDAPQAKEQALMRLSREKSAENLAQELHTGTPTLIDIFKQLARPGRDPREDLPKPILRSDVLSMSDLVNGMELKGTVRNVVDFGAFVDVGVKQDGLLHRSQIPAGTDLKVGNVIHVKILSVEKERGRISLGWTK
ncbi:MAG: RNA-binding transcriptional accessory protein [Chloroflexota bacterium]|nr:MAG: RNA-binding transcriptional accessory protein [Chloroflexota bacterium]